MKDRKLLAKYSDHSIVEINIANARRKFGFSFYSERDFIKMLYRERINLAVMSLEIFRTFTRKFDRENNFGIAEDPEYFFIDFYGRIGIIDKFMNKNELLLMDDEENAVVVNFNGVDE